MRPSRECRDLVLGVIARALVLYPAVSVHAFAFLSNHYHMLASADDGGSVARFLNFLNSNIARELGRLYGWDGRFWQRRASAIEVVDDDAIIGRLRYVMSHGIKEGLVARASEWSGATSTPALIGGEPLEGVWVNRDLETRATRRGRILQADEYRQRLPLALAPIPPWASLPADDRAARHRALIVDIEAAADRSRPHPPLGIRAVETQDPHARPARSKRGPAPLCHASTAEARSAFRSAYRAFVDAFRTAADAVRAAGNALFARFPSGSTPRPAIYVPFSASDDCEARTAPSMLTARAFTVLQSRPIAATG